MQSNITQRKCLSYHKFYSHPNFKRYAPPQLFYHSHNHQFMATNNHIPFTPFLKTQPTHQHSINKSSQKKLHFIRKNLGTSSNSKSMSSHSKDIPHNLRDSRIDESRFMSIPCLKLKDVGNGLSGENTERKQQIKRQRKQGKSSERTQDKKMFNDDSADYYKYWKKKAADYQQLNFTLNRQNSAVQEENEILKYQIDKMQKKLAKFQQPQPKPNIHTQNYDKLENYYRARMEQLNKKIDDQQILIKKQEKKIRELSNKISENYQLRNLLDNMEDKKSQLKSIGSRDGSINLIPQKNQKKDRQSQFLTVQCIQQTKQNSATSHSIRDKKNGVINFNLTHGKPNSSKWL